ncbi:MAG: hypothetical protein KC561_04400 [Myxococcales bacterium]|nr:hypothetical protein [Myxococcales bacterium]
MASSKGIQVLASDDHGQLKLTVRFAEVTYARKTIQHLLLKGDIKIRARASTLEMAYDPEVDFELDHACARIEVDVRPTPDGLLVLSPVGSTEDVVLLAIALGLSLPKAMDPDQPSRLGEHHPTPRRTGRGTHVDGVPGHSITWRRLRNPDRRDVVGYMSDEQFEELMESHARRARDKNLPADLPSDLEPVVEASISPGPSTGPPLRDARELEPEDSARLTVADGTAVMLDLEPEAAKIFVPDGVGFSLSDEQEALDLVFPETDTFETAAVPEPPATGRYPTVHSSTAAHTMEREPVQHRPVGPSSTTREVPTQRESPTREPPASLSAMAARWSERERTGRKTIAAETMAFDQTPPFSVPQTLHAFAFQEKKKKKVVVWSASLNELLDEALRKSETGGETELQFTFDGAHWSAHCVGGALHGLFRDPTTSHESLAVALFRAGVINAQDAERTVKLADQATISERDAVAVLGLVEPAVLERLADAFAAKNLSRLPAGTPLEGAMSFRSVHLTVQTPVSALPDLGSTSTTPSGVPAATDMRELELKTKIQAARLNLYRFREFTKKQQGAHQKPHRHTQFKLGTSPQNAARILELDRKGLDFLDHCLTEWHTLAELYRISAIGKPLTFAIVFTLLEAGLLDVNDSDNAGARSRTSLSPEIERLHSEAITKDYFEFLGIHWNSGKQKVLAAINRIRAKLDDDAIEEEAEHIADLVPGILEHLAVLEEELVPSDSRRAYRARIVPEFKFKQAISLLEKQFETAWFRKDRTAAHGFMEEMTELDAERGKRMELRMKGLI